MKEFASYLLKSGLWITVFWCIYWFFLRKDTFHQFNRYFLLTGLMVSLTLPFFIYHYKVAVNLSIQDYYTPYATATQTPSAINIWQLLLIIHALGAVFLLIRHFTGVWKIKKLIRLHGYTREADTKVVHVSPSHVTFSMFNYMFIDSSAAISATERKLIYEHEKAHIEQRHWIDLLLSHFICIVQWFNPFAWLYLQAIKQNHEFLADHAVLQKGNSPALYRATLINYTLHTPVFAFANAFAQYNKFKRINMMKKMPSNPVKKLATLLLVPALALFLWAFAEPEYIINSVQPEKREVAPANIDVKEKDDKIVVIGYGPTNSVKKKKKQVNIVAVTQDTIISTGKARISIRNNNVNNPLIILDGKSVGSLERIHPDNIQSVSILKDAKAIELYGEEAKNGVIIITSKTEGEKEPSLSKSDNSVKISITDLPHIPSDNIKAFSEYHLRGQLKELKPSDETLIIVDGKESKVGFDQIDQNTIESISILRDQNNLFNDKEKKGVIIVTTKKNIK